MKRKKTRKVQQLLIVFLLAMSISSFIYVQNVDLPTPEQKVQTRYAEDLEESEELMPDLHLIKRVMHKAMEFVTFSPPMF